MKTSKKLLIAMQAANVVQLVTLLNTAPGVAVNTGFVVVISALGAAALFVRHLERRMAVVSADRSPFLPDAEREVDAMGLNGPPLRQVVSPPPRSA